jgi:hypothetical protein
MRTLLALIIASTLSACAAPGYYYPASQAFPAGGYGAAEASIYVAPPVISPPIYPVPPPVIYRPAYRGYYGPPPPAFRPPPPVYGPPAATFRPPTISVPPLAVQPYRVVPTPWLRPPGPRGRRA